MVRLNTDNDENFGTLIMIELINRSLIAPIVNPQSCSIIYSIRQVLLSLQHVNVFDVIVVIEQNASDSLTILDGDVRLAARIDGDTRLAEGDDQLLAGRVPLQRADVNVV